MTEESLSELKKLSLKNPCVKEALDFILSVMESPHYDGYKTVLFTINKINSEIQTSQVILDDEEKRFDKINKYIPEINSYYAQLDLLRGKMMPQQVQSANEEVRTLFERAQKNLTNGKEN